MTNEIVYEARKNWLKERKRGIGGSDAACILGIGYKSALELWDDKVNERDLTDDETEQMEWGNILEDPIAKRYSRTTGRLLIDPGRFAIVFSQKYSFAHCTVDRIIPETTPTTDVPQKIPFPDFARGSGSLSVKNAGFYMTNQWEEEPPVQFNVQLQHELAVRNWNWGSFAVLLGGNKFRWCDVPRNDNFINLLMEQEEHFWNRVKSGSPPAPDASDSARETLLRLYPKDTGTTKALPFQAQEWADKLAKAKEEIKAAEAVKIEMENLIKAEIGDATFGVLPDSRKFSWKYQKRASYVVQQSEFRVLKEIKNANQSR